MKNANLELSKKEYELIINSDFILTKNRIIEKVNMLLGNLSNSYTNVLANYSPYLPGEIFEISPKIYKGEQYQHLPYLMLDYPRYFSRTDVFAIRSFFWWGNYFSITLQLSGKYLEMFRDNVFQFINDKKNKDWFIGVNHSEWEHHFEKDNFLPFTEIDDKKFLELNTKTFIKIAKKLPLESWQNAIIFFEENYKYLIEYLCRSTA